jgi:hypothetical protein
MTFAGYGRDTPPLRRSLVGSEWLQLSPLERARPASPSQGRGVPPAPFFGPGLARAKRGYLRSEPRGLLLTAGARLLWEGVGGCAFRGVARLTVFRAQSLDGWVLLLQVAHWPAHRERAVPAPSRQLAV